MAVSKLMYGTLPFSLLKKIILANNQTNFKAKTLFNVYSHILTTSLTVKV